MKDLISRMSLRQFQYYSRILREEFKKKGLLVVISFCTVPFWFSIWLLISNIETSAAFENALGFSLIFFMVIMMAARYLSIKNFAWWTSGQRKWLLIFPPMFSLPLLMEFALHKTPQWIWFFVSIFASFTAICYGNRPMLDSAGKYLGIFDIRMKNIENKRELDLMLHASYRFKQELVFDDEEGNLKWNLPEIVSEEFEKDISEDVRKQFEEMRKFRYYYLFYCESESITEEKFFLHVFTNEPISDRRLNYFYHTPLNGAGYITPQQRKYQLEDASIWAQNIYLFNYEPKEQDITYYQRVAPREAIELFVDKVTSIEAKMNDVRGLESTNRALKDENIGLITALKDQNQTLVNEIRGMCELLGEHNIEWGLSKRKEEEPVEEKRGFVTSHFTEKTLLYILFGFLALLLILTRFG